VTSGGSSDPDIRENFRRQRRSLIAASVVLLAYVSAGVEFPSQLTVFGGTFTLRRPEWVGYTLWLLWAYLGWRYYQHYHDHPDRQRIVLRKAERFHVLVDGLASQILRRNMCREQKWLAATFSFQVDHTVSDTAVGRLVGDTARGDLIVEVTGSAEGVAKSESGTVFVTVPFSQRPIVLSRWELIPLRAQAWGHVVLRTPLFTELYLPFLLAATPLLFLIGQAVVRLLPRLLG
jgi:hypothetical protein